MDDKSFDNQSARNLFSKVEKISFGFLNIREIKIPFLNLFFRHGDRKQAHTVFQQLSDNLDIEKLKLSIIENGGDYLTVTFLWESRDVLFSSSPDFYNKRECKQFRLNVFYGDVVKIFFVVKDDDHEILIEENRAGVRVINLDAVYYEYIP